ncbi:MAG TPA: conjugative transposon protein TraM, partial [Puia sp.]|nr:conjugative transposon protein TraM [Puia sp.]
LLPLVVVPFLCLVFHVLGGGRGATRSKGVNALGLNTQLPSLSVDLQKAFQDKLKTYEQADNDSARKAQYQRQDPYRRDSPGGDRRVLPAGKPVETRLDADDRAKQLEQQLGRLQQSLHPAAPVIRPLMPIPPRGLELPEERAPDPQLDRLNAMLDKVIRIQHPEAPGAAPTATPNASMPVEEVSPVDSNANSIAAVIPDDQTLVAGTTLSLRLTDPVRVGGRILPAGELVYGPVSINNDRLMVHISSLRQDHNLFTVDWQVYDLDGLAGIHIPGMLGRDVAKQSADQGVNALNVMTLDPSLGAQAAGAGIQAAKTYLGRKVRQVRVTVRAGYQVLLRNSRAGGSRAKPVSPPEVHPDSLLARPEWEPAGPVLERCRREGMEVALRMVCIRDSCLWFGLEWRNRSPIGLTPAYVRWSVRDRRAFRRTALQEQTIEPLSAPALRPVPGDSTVNSFTGFRPFAVPRDKQLVVEIGEKNGGRALELIIPYQQILKAKTYAKASEQ